MTTINIFIEQGPEGIDVDFYGNPTWENDGIGGYEYFGAKCYDFGNTYAVCEIIEWDKAKHTDEENAIIDAYFDEHESKIEAQLLAKFEKEYTENVQRYPEPDYDF